jgi:hypothetical protein
VAGANRTIRRYPGGAVVSVRLRGRPFEAATADMVDGVLAANRVAEPDASRLRAALTSALADEPVDASVDEPASPAARAA